jgi:hypothetical protein
VIEELLQTHHQHCQVFIPSVFMFVVNFSDWAVSGVPFSMELDFVIIMEIISTINVQFGKLPFDHVYDEDLRLLI